MNVRLQTAGIARLEQLQKCYDEGARDINISLDSLIEEKQDYINTTPGSWKAAIEAIARVSQVFHGESAICSVGCVMSKMNMKELPAILEFCTEIGWHLSLVPVHITKPSENMGFRSYDTNFECQEADEDLLETTIEQLIQMKRAGALLFDAEAYLRSSILFLKNGQSSWRNKGRCDSPYLYFAIRPNGDFTSCCDYALHKPPSLAEPDFHLRYKKGELASLANPIVKNCSGCHYGSYPEVTLSVRDKQALVERIKLTLFRKKEK